MIENKSFFYILLFSYCVLFNPAKATAVAGFDEVGKLSGFSGVIVDGLEYNVVFREGTFDSIFNEGDDLDFSTASGARNAAIEIFNLIHEPRFISFDLDPSRIHGIEELIFGAIIVPYQVINSKDVNTVGFANEGAAAGNRDSVFDAVGLRKLDTTLDPFSVYADWSNVPVPPSLFLMASSLLGLLGFSRKKIKVVSAIST